MTSFKVLYFLDHDEYAFVEIKRIDLVGVTDKAKIYFWLMFDKLNGRLQKLDFVSMRSDSPGEERIFRQGQLFFNAIEGQFKGDGDVLIPLKTQQPSDLDTSMTQAIEKFLM